MPDQGLEWLPFFAPKFDGFIPTSSGKNLTVRAERDTQNSIVMPKEGVE